MMYIDDEATDNYVLVSLVVVAIRQCSNDCSDYLLRMSSVLSEILHAPSLLVCAIQYASSSLCANPDQCFDKFKIVLVVQFTHREVQLCPCQTCRMLVMCLIQSAY